MTNPKPRRVGRSLTSQQGARLQKNRRKIAAELPELIGGDRMRREAKNEPTLSGELRRAIHASTLTLSEIAEGASVTPLVLDEFLTGERTLRSDVLDRLASQLGLELTARG